MQEHGDINSTGTGLQDLSLAPAVLDRADGVGGELDEMPGLKTFGPTGRT